MFHKESPRFSTSNHEYLVAQVDLEGICVGFVRMERTVDHTRKDGSSLSIASTSSSGSIPAPDQITICGPGHLSLVAKSGEMISSYKPLDPLPFAALVAACSIVSTHEPLYRLLTSQCYWYAGLVSRLLIGETGVARRLANAQRNEGVWQEFLQVVSDKTMVEMANMLRPDYVEKLQKLQYMPQARRQKRLQEAEADRMLAQAQAGSAPVAEGL
ncbi:hypothetical protein FOMPIDRAFT_90962 [Fomitopsis schrenkii]|uniref:Uncharacterized protein n=1 Tax=Fomitopsis schrenkii TaxID=2126942 RepID=S8EE43_FOMSC|nr:hypothetical protein FOMPIDRAFT_90962 [Fomitopsis schrenkii]